ncbi:MAG: phosphoribosylformylglycinamidine synthase subunit PurS [bacterium]
MSNNQKATVYVKLKEGVLDPQGVTIQKALVQMGYDEFLSVRTGKFFELEIRADAADFEEKVREVSSKLLSNPVVESFEVEQAQ